MKSNLNMNDDRLNEYGVRDFNYFSLVRKSDNKEVYTSPEFKIQENVLDVEKISTTLNFYFDRVNTAILQQKNNPKMSEEQKSELKLLEKKDYIVQLKKFMPIGMHEPIFWTKEAEDFLKK